MSLRWPVLLAALVAALFAAGCPITKQGSLPPDAVLLQYQFPRGRVLVYRMEAKTRMRFSMPFIRDVQEVRSETVLDIVEEVLQEPMGGFATIEQRVGNMRFVLYQGNRLLFDSTRPREFPPMPQLESLLDLQGMTVRFEISTSGDIRRSEGLEELSYIMGPGTMSRIFQGAQPVLPRDYVSPGQSWESRREIPFMSGQAFQGSMKIADKTRLVKLGGTEGARQAVIELERKLFIRMDATGKVKRRRAKPAVKGKGEATSTIVLDIDRGVILSNSGRIRVSTSTVVSDQPFFENLILEIEGLFKSSLIE